MSILILRQTTTREVVCLFNSVSDAYLQLFFFRISVWLFPLPRYLLWTCVPCPVALFSILFTRFPSLLFFFPDLVLLDINIVYDFTPLVACVVDGSSES